MTIEYIRYRVSADRAAAFEDAYRRAVAHLAAAPEFRDVELSRCEEDPESYVIRLTWTSTRDHLEGFRKGPHFPPFFAEVREFVDDIEEMRHYAPVDIADPVPTLYEWAGSAEALTKLFDAFYRRVPDDEVLAPVFAGMHPHHAEHVAAWLGEVFGGPRAYSEHHGATRTWWPSTWAGASPSGSAGGGSSSCRTPPTSSACRTTPSSARRSPATWSGAPGWPSSSPRRAPRPTSTNPCRPGAGATSAPGRADPIRRWGCGRACGRP
ncbi:antibiotic biosynthesis monooxygenase [Actinokineospora auranticolor]|uniref:antibiotic biosynthesis monooxygenase n=1 Tax=Actinokineospora auranticolor TaxID=155976 RepID=UPI001FE86DC1|nr:antibiotic biosynthesis monooxygenase [Actinokineospora auranticolor]